MRNGWIVALIGVALCGCAHNSDLSLTQWGTSCRDYGLSPSQCQAKFANYADYLAQANSGQQARRRQLAAPRAGSGG
jgi:hypothetical protein